MPAAPPGPSIFYTLSGTTPVPCNEPLEWERWFATASRSVGDDIVGNVRLSTVFLGMDHSFTRSHRPELFETRAFADTGTGEPLPLVFARYATWEAAAAGHAFYHRRLLGEFEIAHVLTADLLASLTVTG